MHRPDQKTVHKHAGLIRSYTLFLPSLLLYNLLDVVNMKSWRKDSVEIQIVLD